MKEIHSELKEEVRKSENEQEKLMRTVEELKNQLHSHFSSTEIHQPEVQESGMLNDMKRMEK